MSTCYGERGELSTTSESRLSQRTFSLYIHICIIDSLVGSDRLESAWKDYSKSPVLTHFDWSPIVHAGVNRNIHLLAPSGGYRIMRRKLLQASTIPGLVTMHVRRGDYEHRTCDYSLCLFIWPIRCLHFIKLLSLSLAFFSSKLCPCYRLQVDGTVR